MLLLELFATGFTDDVGGFPCQAFFINRGTDKVSCVNYEDKEDFNLAKDQYNLHLRNLKIRLQRRNSK